MIQIRPEIGVPLHPATHDLVHCGVWPDQQPVGVHTVLVLQGHLLCGHLPVSLHHWCGVLGRELPVLGWKSLQHCLCVGRLLHKPAVVDDQEVALRGTVQLDTGLLFVHLCFVSRQKNEFKKLIPSHKNSSFFPESIRWQFFNGQTKEAVKQIEYVAKVNGIKLDTALVQEASVFAPKKEDKSSASIADLFRNQLTRQWSYSLIYVW